MCGIAAIVSPHRGVDPRELVAMTSAVRHRGPDDEGYALFSGSEARCFGGPDTPADCYALRAPFAPVEGAGAPLQRAEVGFGHRRLAILDVSPLGHQPMCSTDGRYWILFNGEVYNYLELRAELAALGHSFISGTDTEVVLAAFAEWGAECFQRFNGMFAILLLDRVARRLVAARDRFGVKPLYYWISPEGDLAFASEIKQFTVLDGWRPRLDAQRAYDFLAWGMADHTGDTMFEGVHQIRGGELVELALTSEGFQESLRRRESLQTRAWYRLTPRAFEGSLQDAAIEFRELLTDSIRLRLRADVPVGSCLSGGLDSSSIVCLLHLLLTESGGSELQRTVSAGSDEARFDERRYIDAVVAQTGVRGSHVIPSPERLFETMGCLTWMQDEPFGSTSIFAQYLVFELAAREGITVMLDGQGADESLAGYHGFFGPHLVDLLRSGRLGEFRAEMAAMRSLHGHQWSWVMKQVVGAAVPASLEPLARRLGARGQNVPLWLNGDALNAEHKNPLRQFGMPRSVAELSRAQIESTNLPLLLHWEDRNSMAHSIEARVPFLDYRLVEFILGLPAEFKVHRGVTKRVQREAMAPVLPRAVSARHDKLGFVTPEEIWMRQRHPLRFRALLESAVQSSGGIISPRSLKHFDRVVDGDVPFSFEVWRAISFGAWMERFGVAS